MNIDDQNERVPIPKWKSLSQTPSRELISAKKIAPAQEILLERSNRAAHLYSRWQSNPTLDNALEVVDCAMLLDNVALFIGPAEQILNSDIVLGTPKLIALDILSPTRRLFTAEKEIYSNSELKVLIRQNRARLKEETRNSVLYAEQARLYTLIGENYSAKKSFLHALAISPNNRHILRTFARFMLHVPDSKYFDPDEALARLRRSEAIKSDPWLQAAEISVSEFTEKQSKMAKIATRLVESGNLNPNHISEVSTALATLELSHGNSKKFKRRINGSLIMPTDNALSQLMWFGKSSNVDWDEETSVFLGRELDLRESIEATTYRNIKSSDWEGTVDSFRNWQSEERYSSHIAIQGSYYSLAYARDYEAAIHMCDIGLEANRKSKDLLNNRCVAQNRFGDIGAAEITLAELKVAEPNWRNDAVFVATKGMVDFSVGNHTNARNAYSTAIALADVKKDKDLSTRAKMHWLYEESRNNCIGRERFDGLSLRLESADGYTSSVVSTHELWEVMKSEIRNLPQDRAIQNDSEDDDQAKIENFL